MSGPAGRLRRPNRIQLSIVLTVGLSGGLVGAYADAPPLAILAATAIGLFVGALLAAYLTWIAPSTGNDERRREF